MQTTNNTELNSQLWQRFKTAHARDKLPQALLLIGSETSNLVDFSYKMAATLVCTAIEKPCYCCKPCRLVKQAEHPDLSFLQPDDSGLIKIDKIRELHTLAYRSPQMGRDRIIIIYQVEKMNVAAANALLKLLEEPPASLRFFLIAEQILNLPATIISRCQLWRAIQTNYLISDFLTLAQNHKTESERGLVFQQLPLIIDGLVAIQAKKVSSLTLAAKWVSYEFNPLIWLLYLITSQLIEYKFNNIHQKEFWTEQMDSLAKNFKPDHLFKQLDQLNDISKKLQSNNNMNHLLVLENFLLGYSQIE
ncbi:MAG: hypothetical protein H0U70_05830 [Tatlockia sp.]|nr:hypothetical protein [Tatlockia sp.]